MSVLFERGILFGGIDSGVDVNSFVRVNAMTSEEAGAPGAAWHDQRVAWLRQTDDAILPRPQAPAGGWIADGGQTNWRVKIIINIPPVLFFFGLILNWCRFF